MLKTKATATLLAMALCFVPYAALACGIQCATQRHAANASVEAPSACCELEGSLPAGAENAGVARPLGPAAGLCLERCCNPSMDAALHMTAPGLSQGQDHPLQSVVATGVLPLPILAPATTADRPAVGRLSSLGAPLLPRFAPVLRI